MQDLTVAGITVRQTEDGLYRLNDFQKAAEAQGVNRDIRPQTWLRNEQTQRLLDTFNDPEARNLVAEENQQLKTTRNLVVEQNQPLRQVSGRNGGTYVNEDLVIAYAMWVDPYFYLHVIRVFLDHLKRHQVRYVVTLNDLGEALPAEGGKNSAELLGYRLNLVIRTWERLGMGHHLYLREDGDHLMSLDLATAVVEKCAPYLFDDICRYSEVRKVLSTLAAKMADNRDEVIEALNHQ